MGIDLGIEPKEMTDSVKAAAAVMPSARQFEWQKTEFYAFAHFGVNTYTDSEWGTGKESPSIFNPVKFDARQWARAVKSAGMKGLILTCKHHDGFCLWPSAYTEHSVKNSPYKGGKGDIAREVSEACAAYGLKFGVYLSPWDMNAPTYGKGAAYDDYYVNQLTELLTQYGDVFEIWFDGACGEGENGKKQVYDWQRYIKTCRALQPNAVTFNVGDIRWCGNEAGHAREEEWSALSAAFSSLDVIFQQAQNEVDTDGAFRRKGIEIDSLNLGGRDVIEGASRFVWYPCETDTSIRPGWFYHASEDGKVRGLDELMDIYYKTVGGNSSFLLNIPPTKEGLFHENDVKRLNEIGERIRAEFTLNLAKSGVPNMRRKGCVYFIEVPLQRTAAVRRVVIAEDIRRGQQVEAFEIWANDKLIYSGRTIGYKKIAVLNEAITTNNVIIKITQNRMEPAPSFVGVY